MYRFSSQDEDTCSYSGLFGVLISLTCLIQLIVYSTSYWIVFVLLALYLLCATAFSMLAFKHRAAPVLLIIACVLALAAEVYYLLTVVFSVIVTILFIYSTTVTVYIYVTGIPAKLARLYNEKKAEENQWRDRLN